MTLNVKINDAGLRTKLARAESVLPEIINDSLKSIGAELEREMKLEVPVDTGILRASIIHQVRGDSLIVGVSRTAPYGKFVALGTRFRRPDPFHLRAVANVRGNIRAILRDAVVRRTAGLR